MEQPLQVLVLQKEELGVVGYTQGELIVYPFFFFFLCFGKIVFKECQEKKWQSRKKSRL